MKNMSKIMFMFIMIISLIMVSSSSNMMSMWVSLEINMMMFIPLMNEKNNSQSMMMYFLTQSMASMMFMISILNNNMFNMMMLMSLSMFMKMGMPPFHQWLPEIMAKISWNLCFLMMTLQKIPPMMVMTQIMENNYMNNLIIISSIVFSAIIGLNQTSMRKLMAYSSMSHTGWMLMCMKLSNKSWMSYMMIYMIMMMMMCQFLSKMNIFYLNQMNIQMMENSNKIMLMMSMMSMGGMPPFLGFLPKWMTIQLIIKSEEMFMMLIMLFMSVVTMFYYLRMMSSISMISSISQKWMNFKNMNMLIMYMYMINIMMPASILMIKLL
uniref:NADH-ubiquinone oxidoreductase chain 2 n=1 Tax=Dicyphus sp. TaxID=2931289 RepID=A0A8T9ZXX2_9HEMI|nr:NADH dehydrogenase subunit 2 [Dicyphus sp.]